VLSKIQRAAVIVVDQALLDHLEYKHRISRLLPCPESGFSLLDPVPFHEAARVLRTQKDKRLWVPLECFRYSRILLDDLLFHFRAFSGVSRYLLEYAPTRPECESVLTQCLLGHSFFANRPSPMILRQVWRMGRVWVTTLKPKVASNFVVTLSPSLEELKQYQSNLLDRSVSNRELLLYLSYPPGESEPRERSLIPEYTLSVIRNTVLSFHQQKISRLLWSFLHDLHLADSKTCLWNARRDYIFVQQSLTDLPRGLCPVCYEKSVDSVTRCGHWFCRTCVAKQLALKQFECPMCKSAIHSSSVYHVSELHQEPKTTKLEFVISRIREHLSQAQKEHLIVVSQSAAFFKKLETCLTDSERSRVGYLETETRPVILWNRTGSLRDSFRFLEPICDVLFVEPLLQHQWPFETWCSSASGPCRFVYLVLENTLETVLPVLRVSSRPDT